MKHQLLLFNLVILSTGVWSQIDTNVLNYKHIRSQDIIWQKTIWRSLDLTHPSNISYFREGAEITNLILFKIKNNELSVFENDSLSQSTKMTALAFKEKLKIPSINKSDSLLQNFTARDITSLEIKEKYIFDKQRSQLIIQPVGISLIIEANHPLNPYGIDLVLGTIDFIELVRLEETLSTNNWYNPRNEIADLTFTKAIEIRKFYAPIVKVNNPWNEYLDQYMSSEEAHWAGIRIENQIREFEYSLWCDHP